VCERAKEASAVAAFPPMPAAPPPGATGFSDHAARHSRLMPTPADYRHYSPDLPEFYSSPAAPLIFAAERFLLPYDY
jgi:hypothetical protein